MIEAVIVGGADEPLTDGKVTAPGSPLQVQARCAQAALAQAGLTLMAKPLPVVDPFAKPCLDALQRRLVLRSCRDCGQPRSYPRELCLHCHDDLEWIDATGGGEIRSYTVARRPAAPAFTEDTPYVLAIVQLDEGSRMMTWIDGARSAVAIGRRVGIHYVDAEDGFVLPHLVIAEGEG